MRDLDFIKDKELRKTLEDSIEYIYALFEQSKDSKQKKSYQEETYRVIILYVVSAIEAILLYFYKARGRKLNIQNINLCVRFLRSMRMAKNSTPLSLLQCKNWSKTRAPARYTRTCCILQAKESYSREDRQENFRYE